jgi:hypothetical protein
MPGSNEDESACMRVGGTESRDFDQLAFPTLSCILFKLKHIVGTLIKVSNHYFVNVHSVIATFNMRGIFGRYAWYFSTQFHHG